MNMNLYVGCTVELNYLDEWGRLSQRRVIVRKAEEDRLEVYCLQKKQPRRLRVERILAIRRLGDRRIG